MKRRVLSLIMALCMVLTLLPVSAFAATITDSGECGDNLTWTLDSDGVLTISGTGKMRDYDSDWYDSVTTAPWGQYYSSITKVVINSGVTSIGDSAFYGCSSLTSVTIGNSVASIGDYAFSTCRKLTSITIPNSVTSIGKSAFEYCRSLTSVTIPDSVTSIGGSAFSGCSSLTNVTIPNSVTSIGYSAFYGCSSLTSVTIPNSVTSIGYSAFYGCSSLTNVTIPNSVTSIGDWAFNLCDNLTSVTIGNGVTSIGRSAFCDCTALTSIILPDSLTIIGEAAFSTCRKLTSITIPNSVTSIGEDAFNLCDNLTSVTIGNGVTSIGDYAFCYCDSLMSIAVSSQNKNYASLDGVLFNKSKTTLIQYPCSKSDSYTIPDSVTNIGDWAFNDCYSLTSVTIPDSVTSIGDLAFCNCHSLTNITIPDSVTSIGEYAFSRCWSLTSVTIGNGVTSIGECAFRNCDSLMSIAVSSQNKNYASLDGVLFNKSKTTLIQYPCSKSDSYTIPDSVTNIGDWAFNDCYSLTSVTIPDSVTSIGDWAFNDCYSLTDVYYSGSEAQWQQISISEDNECLTNATIHYNGKEDAKKAIIVVPGITGSELFDSNTGKRYWAADEFGLNKQSVTTVWAMLSTLYCDEKGNPTNENVTVMGESTSPYGTQDTYKSLITELRGRYDSDYGGNGEYDVRLFSYDWRLTNSKSAAKLDEFIKSNGYDEVVLIGHSMGGIVAAYCTGVIASDDYVVDKLITLGTPYYGAPKAYGAFTTGQFIDNKVSYPFVKNLAAHNISGLFELLPNSRYFGNNNGYSNRLLKYLGNYYDYTSTVNTYTETGWYNSKLYTQAEELYDTLAPAYAKMISGEINFYGIVGYNEKTTEGYSYVRHSYRAHSGGTSQWVLSDTIVDQNGDGTVPLASATMGFADTARDWYYVKDTSHNNLVKKSYSVQLVCNIIDGKGDTEKYNENCNGKVSREAGEVTTLSGYKVIAACPVDLSFYDKSGNLLGTITKDGIIAAEGHEYDFYVCGEDNEIKIAYLDEEADIVITGNDDGVMDLRVEKTEDGEVTDEIAYIDVPITESTVISTETSVDSTAQLELDASGEGLEKTIIKPNDSHSASHNVVHYEETEASCTEEGCGEYWYCKDCGRYYEDEDCTIETKHDFVIAEKLLHDYVNGKCSVCGAKDPDYTTDCGGDKSKCASADYLDVPAYSVWSHKGIDFVISRGIMGSTKTDKLTFEPSTSCTRAMIVSILYRMQNSPTVTYTAKFSDIQADKWYTDAVIWAAQNGVVSGYTNGTFGPNDKLTREQLAVILMNYTDKVLHKDISARADISTFPDAGSATWSKSAMQWAVANGLISGSANGGKTYLMPQGNAARDQVASIFMRYITNIAEA